jgi:hypothetical protein
MHPGDSREELTMVRVRLSDIKRALPKGTGVKRERPPCPKCGDRVCQCLELSMLGQMRDMQWPTPERQYKFAPGRQWRFDIAYPSVKIAIECDGGTWVNGGHNRGVGYESNCEKTNLAAIHGWLVLRVTTDMIADGRALTFVERALRVRGLPVVRPEDKQLAFGYPPR